MAAPRAFRILSQLHKASRQIALAMHDECRAHGVSSSEAHLLGYTAAYGPCAISELHRVLGYNRSTLTAMLDRLEQQGLVERQGNPADRRSWLVAVTSAGMKTALRLRRLHLAFEERVLAQVSEKDMQGFLRVLNAIGEVSGVTVREKG